MPRKITVVTTAGAGRQGATLDENRTRALDLLDLACTQKPDIVCLPEGFASAGVVLPLAEKAETVPGPTTDACAGRARKHRTYVVCPVTNRREGRFYNSAVILDRGGHVAGVYDKIHPVTTTDDFTVMENGMTPGPGGVAGAPVFELDFGRVGCQICFDLGFPETWKGLAEGGAELVFWPSAYDGGFPLRVYAWLHKYYVVSSVRSKISRIINPLGEVLEATGGRMRIASRVVDLDTIVCHTDFHVGIAERLLRDHGRDVTVRVCEEEGHFMVESNRDDLPLAGLVERYGLEPADRYHARHLPAYEDILAGRKPSSQTTPYKGRPQWG